jgi:serine/threonine protein kinase
VTSDHKQSNCDNLDSSAEEEVFLDQPAVACRTDGHSEPVIAANDPLIGKTISRNYQILSCRGRGGMSVVYKARDLSADRYVAVKILPCDNKSREETLLRFQREARLLGRLDHPNVIRVHAFDFTADRQPFFVMDYVEGHTLAERIAHDAPVPLKTSIEIFLQICRGLAHAHQKGILHRDLKPSNIMLITSESQDVQVKILDFGIGKLLETSSSYSQQLTKTGDVFGSPLYMSPEQGLGRPLTVSSDIYSMGCLMFETLTGAPPFLGKTMVETILKHQTERPLLLREATLGANFSEILEGIVSKCLAKDPLERYQSADELGESLHNLQTGKSKSVGTHGANSDIKKSKRPPALILVAVAAILLIALVFCIKKGHKRHPTADAHYPPSEQIIRELPKLSKEEQDDAKVAFDVKYLTNSTHLDYRGYRLTEQGFAQLENMHQLSSLNLSLSSANDSALKSLGSLKHLSELQLAMTGVTDEGMKPLEHLPLSSLNLAHTRITDRGIAILRNVATLRVLNLQASNIDDDALSEIAHLKKLERLYLSNTKVSGAGLARLAGLTALQRLEVADTQVSDAGLKYLKNLRSIIYLDLQGTKITDAGLADLIPLTKLQVLKLGRTKITDSGLSTLLKIQSLSWLLLDHTTVTDKGLLLLPKLKHLSSLNLQNCPRVSKLSLIRLKRQLPRCEVIYIPLLNRLNGEDEPLEQ